MEEIVAAMEEWTAARLEHLAAEKAFNRQRDELSWQRRALPWVEVAAERISL